LKTPMLFHMAALDRGPSPREKLIAFKKKHQIETWHCKGIVDDPWEAFHMPGCRQIAEAHGVDRNASLPEIVSHVCRLLDEAGLTNSGQTERESIRGLCAVIGIPCDL
jgi:hypothetical protein